MNSILLKNRLKYFFVVRGWEFRRRILTSLLFLYYALLFCSRLREVNLEKVPCFDGIKIIGIATRVEHSVIVTNKMHLFLKSVKSHSVDWWLFSFLFSKHVEIKTWGKTRLQRKKEKKQNFEQEKLNGVGALLFKKKLSQTCDQIRTTCLI